MSFTLRPFAQPILLRLFSSSQSTRPGFRSQERNAWLRPSSEKAEDRQRFAVVRPRADLESAGTEVTSIPGNEQSMDHHLAVRLIAERWRCPHHLLDGNLTRKAEKVT